MKKLRQCQDRLFNNLSGSELNSLESVFGTSSWWFTSYFDYEVNFKINKGQNNNYIL